MCIYVDIPLLMSTWLVIYTASAGNRWKNYNKTRSNKNGDTNEFV